MKRGLALLLSSVALLAAAPALAEVRALLVGVSDYTVLDADLKGPSNDVRLMAETLVARGVDPAAMTALVSDPAGLPSALGTGAPTRAGILRAMQATAAEAQPGDTVVFYFSGHGAQAPDASGDEGGGYDEILLPADAAGWKGAVGGVENALIDDELQAWAQGMLARGVRLVGLIDACHSATGFRALGGQGTPRGIAAEALGIPPDAASAPTTAPLVLEGEYVFLYSSQSDERSFEYPLPGSDDWHGEFTLRLAQVLAEAPEASWSQVLAAAADAMVQGPARQVPEGEGPLLEATVFGTGAAEARLPVRNGKLAAGLLRGIAEGAEVALYAEGAGGAPLGTATVGKVTARDATLTGALPEGAAWAEVIAAPPAQPLALAAPARANPDDGLDYAAWLAALPAPLDQPDLVPILVDATVALANGDGVLDPEGPGSTPRVERLANETDAEALARALEQAAHGLRLRETLAGASGRSLTGKAAITVEIERRPGTAEGETCGPPGPAAPHDPERGVTACDQLWLTVTNASGKMQDVSVLYMAKDFEVQPIWPQRNQANRLAPGEKAVIGLQIDAGAGLGLEEIWVLAVPMDDDTGLRVDLTRLASPQMTRDFAGASDPMTLWLEGRMTEDEEAARGFSTKPAALTMIRQMVRLESGSDGPAFGEDALR